MIPKSDDCQLHDFQFDARRGRGRATGANDQEGKDEDQEGNYLIECVAERKR